MVKKKSNGAPSFLHLMGNNGWAWQMYDGWADEEYYKYKAKFLGMYSVEVLAVVADNSNHIRVNGHLGVMWLEVADYPDCERDENNGWSFGDLNDMLLGLMLAEENLVRCGVPFTPDYKFHGPNKANMKRRNDATRKRLDMDRWEKEAWEWANKEDDNA